MPQILFTYGELNVYTYSILTAIGLITGALTVWGIGRDVGWSYSRLLDATIWLLIGAVVGARLWEIVWSLPVYLTVPSEVFRLWQGALSFHGGLLGGVVALITWSRLSAHVDFWYVLDLGATGASLGAVFVWLGLLIHGAVYGVPTAATWAWLLPDLAGVVVPRVPIQAIGLLVSLLLSFSLVLFAWRIPHRRWTGALFLIWMLVNGILLFVLGFWRADPAIWLGLLRLDQVAALTEGIVAAIFLPARWRATR